MEAVQTPPGRSQGLEETESQRRGRGPVYLQVKGRGLREGPQQGRGHEEMEAPGDRGASPRPASVLGAGRAEGEV